MRQSHVGSENSSLAETVLKMIQGQDDPRKVDNENNIGLALQIVMQDRRIACHQIAERFEVFLERAEHFLTEELGFSKVSAKWVPRVYP